MTCPECKGTGKYIGLTVVEDCKACRGLHHDGVYFDVKIENTEPVLLDPGTSYIPRQRVERYMEALKNINGSEYILFENRQAEDRVRRIRTGGPAVISQVDGGIEVKEFRDVIRIDKISWSPGPMGVFVEN